MRPSPGRTDIAEAPAASARGPVRAARAAGARAPATARDTPLEADGHWSLYTADGRGSVRIQKPMMIGRGSCCDLRIDEPELQEHHAFLTPADGAIVVVPLAEGGIAVNGEGITARRTLSDGDWLQLGAAKFQLRGVGLVPDPASEGSGTNPTPPGEPDLMDVTQADLDEWARASPDTGAWAIPSEDVPLARPLEDHVVSEVAPVPAPPFPVGAAAAGSSAGSADAKALRFVLLDGPRAAANVSVSAPVGRAADRGWTWRRWGLAVVQAMVALFAILWPGAVIEEASTAPTPSPRSDARGTTGPMADAVAYEPAVSRRESSDLAARMARADAFFVAGQWLSPNREGSAAGVYLDVVEVHPGAVAARARLNEIVVGVCDEVERSMYALRFDEAALRLRRLDFVGAPRLRRQLGEEALRRWRVVELLLETDTRMQRGQLSSPRGRDALDAVTEALDLEPDNVLADEMRAKVEGMLLASARGAALR